MNPTIIIAEIGECFNGDMEVAYRLIDASKDAGCDYAKFQILDINGLAADDPEYGWFMKVSFSDEEVKKLISYCQERKIQFLGTPENVKKAELLKKLECREVKLASTCLEDMDLINYCAENFQTVFLSTGMTSLDEICKIREKFNKSKKLFIMHCISEYPTGPLLEQRGLKALSEKDVRLNMMLMLKEIFSDCIVGYSDHTSGILTPIAAVAAGAKVIEKHITLDRNTPINNFLEKKSYMGTDHVLSLEPDELKEMVSQIRRIEKMFGQWKWERSEGEKILMSFLRKRFRNNDN